MKPEQQIIAIAEAVARQHGWKREFIDGNGIDAELWISPQGRAYHELPDDQPDYLNDLNAMHEAKTILTGSQCRIYETRLYHLTGSTRHTTFKVLNATASQEAEAFLKTLNLWTKD